MIEPLLLETNHALSWRAWHFDPVLVGGLILAASFYVRDARTAGPSTPRILAFFAGLLLLFLALASPLDVGAGRLFSLHMLQHVVISTWVPPLILMGLTPLMLRPILRARWLGTALKVATHPIVAAPAFIFTMWIWHVPPVYDLAANDPALHYAMHTSFLVTGLMFWWTVLSPAEEVHRFSTGARLFYIFFSGFPMMLLAFMLVATPNPLYEYYEAQPRLWGISAITDQQIGGAVMGTLGELTMFVPFTLLFLRLISEDEEEHDHPQCVSLPPRATIAGKEVTADGQSRADAIQSVNEN